MNSTGIFASYYCPPIWYYVLLLKHHTVIEDIYEHFVKQTYRNRCYIMSPNGLQNLTIPLVKARQKKITKNIKIFNLENWQKIHWKSIEAGYRSSPYFEYYENDFYPFFNEKVYDNLIHFNSELNQKILSLINLKINIKQSSEYKKVYENAIDYRDNIHPRHFFDTEKFPNYIQVFSDRNGFLPNLSILDLLFNEGPNSLNYLKSIEL